MEHSDRHSCLPRLPFDRSRDYLPASSASTPDQATIDDYLNPTPQQDKTSSRNLESYTQALSQDHLSPSEPSVYPQREHSDYAVSFGSFIPFPEYITDAPLESSVDSADARNFPLPRSAGSSVDSATEDVALLRSETSRYSRSDYSSRTPSLHSFATPPENTASSSFEDDAYPTPENIRLPRSEEDIYAAHERLYSQTGDYSDLQHAEEAWKRVCEGPEGVALPPSPPLGDDVQWSRVPTTTSVYWRPESVMLPGSESGSIVTPEDDVCPTPEQSFHLTQSPPGGYISGARGRRQSQMRGHTGFQPAYAILESFSQPPREETVSASSSIYPPLPDSPALRGGYDYHADASPSDSGYTTPHAALDPPVQAKDFSNQVDTIPAPHQPDPKPKKRNCLHQIMQRLCFCNGESAGRSDIDPPSAVHPVPISPVSSYARSARTARPMSSRPTSQAVLLRRVPQTRPYRRSGERLRQQTAKDYGVPQWRGFMGPVVVDALHPHALQEETDDWCGTENDPDSQHNTGHDCQTPASPSNCCDQKDRRDDVEHQCALGRENTHNDVVGQYDATGDGGSDAGNDHGDIALDCDDAKGGCDDGDGHRGDIDSD